MTDWFPTLPGQQSLLSASVDGRRIDGMIVAVFGLGEIGPESFLAAATEIIAHFECLRTSFRSSTHGYEQMVHAPHAREMSKIEFIEAEGSTEQIARHFRVTDADAGSGLERPYARFRYVRRRSSEPVAIVSLHHATVDGISAARIVDQFQLRLRGGAYEGKPRSLRQDVLYAIHGRDHSATYWPDVSRDIEQLARRSTMLPLSAKQHEIRAANIEAGCWRSAAAALRARHLTLQGWFLERLQHRAAAQGRGGMITNQFQLRTHLTRAADGMFTVTRPIVLSVDPDLAMPSSSVQASLLRASLNVVRAPEYDAILSSGPVPAAVREAAAINFLFRSAFGRRPSGRQDPPSYPRGGNERLSWHDIAQPDVACARLTVIEKSSELHVEASFHPDAFPPESSATLIEEIIEGLQSLSREKSAA